MQYRFQVTPKGIVVNDRKNNEKLELLRCSATPVGSVTGEKAQKPPEQISLGQALQNKWMAHDEQCRGGSGDNPKTEKACDNREELSASLKKQGWCLGDFEDLRMRNKWFRCTPSQSAAVIEQKESAEEANFDISLSSNIRIACKLDNKIETKISDWLVNFECVSTDVRKPTKIVLSNHSTFLVGCKPERRFLRSLKTSLFGANESDIDLDWGVVDERKPITSLHSKNMLNLWWVVCKGEKQHFRESHLHHNHLLYKRSRAYSELTEN